MVFVPFRISRCLGLTVVNSAKSLKNITTVLLFCCHGILLILYVYHIHFERSICAATISHTLFARAISCYSCKFYYLALKFSAYLICAPMEMKELFLFMRNGKSFFLLVLSGFISASLWNNLVSDCEHTKDSFGKLHAEYILGNYSNKFNALKYQ